MHFPLNLRETNDVASISLIFVHFMCGFYRHIFHQKCHWHHSNANRKCADHFQFRWFKRFTDKHILHIITSMFDVSEKNGRPMWPNGSSHKLSFVPFLSRKLTCLLKISACTPSTAFNCLCFIQILFHRHLHGEDEPFIVRSSTIAVNANIFIFKIMCCRRRRTDIMILKIATTKWDDRNWKDGSNFSQNA